MSEFYSTGRTRNFCQGIDYQKLWLMLFLKRAVEKKYSFLLATEMRAVAGFDDIVFRYKQNGTTVYMLIQVKHKEDNSKKICVDDLLTRSGNLDLAKHFAAFLEIQYNKELKDKIKDFFFVTNADLGHESLARENIAVETIETQNNFLNIGDGARYKLIDSGGKIAEYLKQNIGSIKAELNKKTKRNEKKRKEISNEEICEGIKSFLNELVLAVNLPNDAELEKLIKDEISNELAERFRYYDENNIVFNDLFVKMSSWMKNKKGHFLTPEKGKEFFQKIKLWANTFGKMALGVEELKKGSARMEKKLDKLIEGKESSNNDRQIYGPVCFNVKHPVKNFVGRKVELEAIHDAFQSSANKKAEVSRIVVISGLGGVGKSELARKYARSKEEYYDSNIIWIDAETQKDLEESFNGLDRKLNRSLSQNAQISLEEKEPITCVVADIYEGFGKVKSLFIFDNVEKYKDIKEFLPLSLPSEYKGAHILITSHDQEWETKNEGDIGVIRLGEFDEIEALEFVKKALSIQNDLQDRKVEELTEELQHFPLALEQAVAYIYNKNKELTPKRKFEISDYLKEYRQQAEKLLKETEELIKEEDRKGIARYTKTILTTWNITRNRIADDEKHGKQAIDVLNVMAYLASDNIDIEEIFAKPIADNEQRLWDAVKLLDRYSMINLREKIVNVHRLVQKVTRLKLREEKREEEVLRRALELINSDNTEKDDMSNIVSIWEHASKHGKLIDDFYFDSIYIRWVTFSIENNNINPLHLLIEYGSYKAIKAILTYIEKYHSNKLIDVVNAVGSYGQTPLHIAAGYGKLSIAKYLVSKGANIHAGEGGYTPVYLAAAFGRLNVARYLASKGADPTTKNIFGGTALHRVAYRGECYAVKYLVNAGSDVNANSTEPGVNGTPLHCAVHSRMPSIVKYLLDRGADVSIEDGEGKTPLYRASGGENLKIVKYLVEKGADICAKGTKEMIPLYAAAKCGSVSIIRYFIDRGININFKDEYGNTMLHLAAGNYNLDAVEYLIKKGAYINARNKDSEFIL